VTDLASPVETSVTEKEASTESGGLPIVVSQTHWLEARPARRARAIAGWAVVAGSCGWLIGLNLAQLTAQTAPWCLVFLGIAGFTLNWLLRKKSGHSLYLFKLGEARPVVISESLAISFVAFTLSLCTFMSIYKMTPHTERIVKQIVDIEFVSNADAEDHHDPLPGNEKKSEEQKKVSSNAVETKQGKTLQQNQATETAKNSSAAQDKPVPGKQVEAPTAARKLAPSDQKRNEKRTDIATKAPASNKRPEPVKSKAKNNESEKPIPTEMVLVRPSAPPVTFAAGSHWVTTNVVPQTNIPLHTISNNKRHFRNQATLEEVSPPEMVEMTDSQGESRATEQWQAGGHSSGGKGAQSTLADYLKELHHRIKRAWAPKAGETHTAQILFRIKRSGKLLSIKLAQSSGNTETDESAMAAVASCSPFKPLPEEFQPDYLDLLYTFNYTVDKLAEASANVE
jgi:TonB family protein